MELRYCESCGDILELEDAGDPVPLEGFVCSKCGGEGSTDEVRAEETSPVRENPPASIPDSSDLSLFSESSITVHGTGASDESRQGGALTESVQTLDIDVCDETGFAYEQTVDAGTESPEFTLALDEDADACGDTDRQGEGDWTTKEIDIPFFDSVDDDTAVGSQLPASRAQKIMFRCPHCKSALSIRPVKSTSRLECPSCEEVVYVTTSGQIFDTPPSIAMRKQRRARSSAPDVSTKKMLSAGLVTSNPLDRDSEKSSNGSASTREKLAAFRRQAVTANPSKTLLITGEKEATRVSDLKLGSRVVRKGSVGISRRETRRGGAAPTMNNADPRDGEVADDGVPGFGAVVPDGESLVRKAVVASKRRAKSRSKAGRGRVSSPALLVSLLLSVPFLVFSALASVPPLESSTVPIDAGVTSVESQAPTVRAEREGARSAATEVDGDSFTAQIGRMVDGGVRAVRTRLGDLTKS